MIMFDIGDVLLYGTKGVCRIEKTEQRYVRGEYKDYLVLRPVFDKDSTIFIPTDSEPARKKMQSILSEEAVTEMIQSIPGEDAVWVSDDNERKAYYTGLIDKCDRRMILRIIITLHIHRTEQEQRGRRLHQSDEVILKQTERLLYDEFAYVLGSTPKEIAQTVSAKIAERN